MKSYGVPSISMLKEAYEALATKAHKKNLISIGQFLVWTQWSRLEPRLAEILVRWIAENYSLINPFRLWRANLRSLQPQTVLVLIEFAKLRVLASKKPESINNFSVWSSFVFKNLGPADSQLFFIPQGTPNPAKGVKAFATSLEPFVKWGFAGIDNLANLKQASSRKTIISAEKRKTILKELLRSRTSVSVNDYLAACAFSIHKRTAQRDLESFPNIKTKGFTQGRLYFLN